MDIHQKIEELTKQLSELARQQTLVGKQIIQLMDELEQLKKQTGAATTTVSQEPVPRKIVEVKEVITPPNKKPVPAETYTTTAEQTYLRKPPVAEKSSTLEEFIGGNLTSKIGILITIIGIFIGAKYAIERNLISPTIRIILGYVCGLILIGIAVRLKKKYDQYSSVLMGGGLAVLYFITYIAYSFYDMMPQLASFGLMLIFTVVTVYAALVYNQIIIAHLGLIGAYAIPFLLSDQSGRYAILFTYIAIINAGILVLSFWKYWKSLFYVSFILTWLIYSIWFTFQYREQHFTIAFVFLAVFFIIFYATFLAYKLVKKEQYAVWDVIVLLSNAFIFYGLGYAILDGNEGTNGLLGIFTLINAAIHLVVSLVIRKLRLADKALFYLLLGLVLTFITIAIPVQLDGNWVTLLWTMEALLVFFIGRTQRRVGYEKLGIVLVLLSFSSLLEDWMRHVDLFGIRDQLATPFLNIVFFTGLLVSVVQGVIIYLHHQKKRADDPIEELLYLQFYDYILPALFLATTYFVFELELHAYFKHLNSNLIGQNNVEEIWAFEFAAHLVYTMIFIGLVTYINERWIRNKVLGTIAMISIVLSIVILMRGFVELNDLAALYRDNANTYFGAGNLLIRYVLIGCAALLLWLGQRSVKLFIGERTLKTLYGAFIHVAILTFISFEYLNWFGWNEDTADNQFKLGLSIIWSVYAFFLILWGINKKKKSWRLTGICFFIITLVKLFMFDLSQATTISKTISFISLGAILLVVSYLYNRYKDVILAEDEDK